MDRIIMFIVGFGIAFFINFIITSFSHSKQKYDGLFILDDSDPNITRWILDVKMDPDEIKNKKEIHLKVCKMEEQEDVRKTCPFGFSHQNLSL